MEIWDEDDDDQELDRLPIDDDPEDDESKESKVSFDEVWDDTSPNCVEQLMTSAEGEDFLKDVGDQVRKDFDSDWESCEQYRENMASDWKVFAGDLPQKDFPWENAANGHIPLALENISRLAFRTYAEVFGEKVFFRAMPMGMDPQSQEESRILTLHQSWQFKYQITDFSRQMHRGVLAFYHVGDVTCHSYYDEIKRRNKHEILTPDEFVIPFVFTTTEPDYSDVPRRTKILRLYKHELQAMRGSWYGVDDVIERKPHGDGFDDEPEARIRSALAEVQGIVVPDGDDGAPYKLLWHEGWFDIPDQDQQRFCKAIVDYDTKRVLLFTVLEEEDWRDKLRFFQQQAELDQFRQAHATFQTTIQQAHERQAALQQRMAAGPIDPNEMAMIQQEMANQPPLPTQPPAPPKWTEDEGLDPMHEDTQPAPVRKVPVHLFSHGVCIEPLVGSLGISYGKIQADINRFIDTALSQFVDAATLANCGGGIVHDLAEVDGDFAVQPGKWNRVKGISLQDMKNVFVPFPNQPANGQLLQLIDLGVKHGESSIQATAALSGESGKSGETYRGFAMRVEQATKQLSVAAGKFTDFTTQIVKNNAYLNSLHLPDEEIVYLYGLNTDGTTPQVKVGRAMYERDMHVEFTTDLRFATQAQKVAESDELMGLGMGVEAMKMNVPYQRWALEQALRARGHDDAIKFLGPQPPPPETTFGIPPPPPPGMVPPTGAAGPAPGPTPGARPGGPLRPQQGAKPPGPPKAPGTGGPPAQPPQGPGPQGP